MRFVVQSSILLCFIATQFSGYNAGVVPTDLQCDGGKCLPKLTLPNLHDFQRRAGGGGGGGKGGGHGNGGGGTGGGGGTSGGDSGSSSTEGGLSNSNQETEGGLGGNCARKRSWSVFWNRSPASCTDTGGGSSQNNNNPPAAPPTPPVAPLPAAPPAVDPATLLGPARSNGGNPATTGQQTYYPATLMSLDERIVEVKRVMGQKNIVNNADSSWFFFSGFEVQPEAYATVKEVSERMGANRIVMDEQRPMGTMEDILLPATADPKRNVLSGHKRRELLLGHELARLCAGHRRESDRSTSKGSTC